MLFKEVGMEGLCMEKKGVEPGAEGVEVALPKMSISVEVMTHDS